jgi:acetylornithine deacetylase/succinyl-diaminopimelate desuccinylase-like protein
MTKVGEAIAFARTRRKDLVRGIKHLIRFATVSSQPQRSAHSHAAAGWLSEQLREAGLRDAQVVATPGLPIVAASWKGAPGRPTLLVYGHIDVQPVDPIRAWNTPPFEPVVRGDHLYGRGSSDNKGPVMVQIHALQSYLKNSGALPVNIVCVYEFEEEIGSPHLHAFLHRNRNRLRADAAVISDTLMAGVDRPSLTYALRGSINAEVEITGPRSELHSGSFGGSLLDPIDALSRILGQLHKEDGSVAIPGFYDAVKRVEDAERREIASAAPSDAALLKLAGAEHGWGEPGYSLHERITIRPALTFTGITGGYEGPGGKSIIPACASAKLNLRLVPEQDPAEMGRLLKQQIERLALPPVRATVSIQQGAHPVLLDRAHPVFKAAFLACRKAWGRPPIWQRSGGSIPLVNLLQSSLGIPTVLFGLSLPDDGRHAPNERVHLPTLEKGVDAYVWLFAAVAAMQVTPARTVLRDGRNGQAVYPE